MDGVGFVFSEDDDIVGIDFDAVISLVDGAEKIIDGDAKRIVDLANQAGAYVEVSPSGAGLHVICRGSLPRAYKASGVEVYDTGRYFTVTGHGRGDVVAAQEVIDAAVALGQSRRGVLSSELESTASRPLPGSKKRSQVIDAILGTWWDQLDDDAKDAELRLMLACFPESVWDGGEQPWLTIIAACARSGAPHAEDIAREFSQRGACYSDREFNSRYRSFR
jgi:primase-polymerase (primpol)-like protein